MKSFKVFLISIFMGFNVSVCVQGMVEIERSFQEKEIALFESYQDLHKEFLELIKQGFANELSEALIGQTMAEYTALELRTLKDFKSHTEDEIKLAVSIKMLDFSISLFTSQLAILEIKGEEKDRALFVKQVISRLTSFKEFLTGIFKEKGFQK